LGYWGIAVLRYWGVGVFGVWCLVFGVWCLVFGVELGNPPSTPEGSHRIAGGKRSATPGTARKGVDPGGCRITQPSIALDLRLASSLGLLCASVL